MIRKRHEILAQLREREGWLKEYGERLSETRSGRLELASIRMELSELYTELEAREQLDFERSGRSAEFVFSAPWQRGHEMPLELLGVLSKELNELVLAVAAMLLGSDAARGKFSEAVKRYKPLTTAEDFVAGSFGFRVYVSADGQEDLVVPPTLPLREVCAMLDGGEDSAHFDKLTRSERVRSKTKALLETLSAHNMEMTIRERGRTSRRIVDGEVIKARLDALKLKLEVEESVRTYRGILIGGHTGNGRFYLKISESETIQGEVAHNSTLLSGVPLDSEVEVEVIERFTGAHGTPDRVLRDLRLIE
jgi:hypothetical protein